ncbi:hypothetical protein KGQ20_36840 [Catenulispora sp. NF23]|uniref:hypothetical protein n=1 Tax=Catenulispora pinistramenti TaxID=2705254 RepID=UPI001BA76B8E|nr:hypothetical protein [Catenulispora pinistramenti]MBS2538332.1 hypothetical protein [Catenulispora pinistramenti]
MITAPGATVQWSDWFARAQPDQLEYVPDDPSGTAVTITLHTTDSASGALDAIPGSKYAPPQLTYDQLLALATSPHIADVIHEVNLLSR